MKIKLKIKFKKRQLDVVLKKINKNVSSHNPQDSPNLSSTGKRAEPFTHSDLAWLTTALFN